MSLSIITKEFNNHSIQVYGTDEKLLFKANDIGKILGITQIRKNIEKIDYDEKVFEVGNTTTGLQKQCFLIF